MLDNDFLQKLSERAARLFPAAVASRKKLEQDMYRLLQSSLGRLNVVTREEFAAQLQVLEQTKAQIAALEEKVRTLESKSSAS